MAYDIKDIKQGFIGAFSAVLLFFALRQGEPIQISPKIGLFVGLFWFYMLYKKSGRTKKSENLKHFIGNFAISIGLTTLFTVWFGMGTFETLSTFDYFGSAAWIGTWMALPIAMLFDKRNINNVLDRYYTRR
jgi:hypothetical protein